MLRIADALIPDGPAGPRPSELAGYTDWLDRAIAARRDAFDDIVALAARLAACRDVELDTELRRLAEIPESGFDVLSSVLAGAYLLTPEVRRAVGYPGQAQRPAPFDEAAEQIMSGILDPVVARGPVYRPTDWVPTTPEDERR